MAFNGFITGNLGRDPELRCLDDGRMVANFTLAVRQAKRRGEDPPARWVKVAIWGRSAQYVADYVRKGDTVGVWGRVDAPELFTKRDGTTGVAEVFTADSVEKFSGGQQQAPAQQQASSYAQASQPAARPAVAPAAAQSLAQATGGQVVDYQDDVPF
jgi:single-strand DNA-binding protein